MTRAAVMHAAEAERRASRTDRVEALFRARPSAWIPVRELLEAGGLCAWRTRIADARKRFVRAGEGTIDWNGNVQASAYRYVPATPVAREAAAREGQRCLF
jgi:hypothetical protein